MGTNSTVLQDTGPHGTPVVPPKRLLLIKIGSIGDVVMAIPGAALMHAQGYAVDWVASEAIAPVLRLYPWIYVIPVNEQQLLRAPVRARLAGIFALWGTLLARTRRQGRYDLVATLYYDPRYRLLTRVVPATRRLWLSQRDRSHALLPGRHHTDEYARILTGTPDGETPHQLAPVPVPPGPALPARKGVPRIVLFAGGARNVLRDDALRRWPVECYVSVAHTLLAEGWQVVLAGGPEDRWVQPHFAALAKTAPKGFFVDQVGTLSLLDTVGLLGSATVTVTHDTGPLHLAGLTQTGLVAIFGPTDPRGRLPRRHSTVALWGGEGFACRPCYDGRDYAPCEHNGCIRQITPALVLSQVRRLREAQAAGQEVSPSVVVSPSTASVAVLPIAGMDSQV